MKQIQKLCDEEWKSTGWQFHDRDGHDYGVWHEAFIMGFRCARALATETVETFSPPDADLLNRIRRLGEENV